MKVRLTIGITAMCLSLLMVSASVASTIPKMPLDHVYNDADMVVQGTVIDSTTEWKEYDGNRLLFTYYTVSVSSSLKKIAPGTQEVIVRTVGGRDATGYNQTLVGEATMTRGEEVVLFLKHEEGWNHPVVKGFFQGKYRVERDDGGEIVSLSRDRGQRPGAQPKFESRLSAWDFMAQMRSLHRGDVEYTGDSDGPLHTLRPVSKAETGRTDELFTAANGFYRTDLNGDGSVDSNDLILLIYSLHLRGGPTDINGDATVLPDLHRLLSAMKADSETRPAMGSVRHDATLKTER